MIICLAGRRVDAANAQEQRFPGTPENLERVRQRIGAALKAQVATLLVSSAACGADLLALDEAGRQGLRSRVVLPFEREKFRSSSVIDRPGDWGELYDRVLDDVERHGDLLVITAASGDDAYANTNHAIVDQALSIGQELSEPVAGILVWDGKSRGPGDLTGEFGAYARSKGIHIVEVSTI